VTPIGDIGGAAGRELTEYGSRMIMAQLVVAAGNGARRSGPGTAAWRSSSSLSVAIATISRRRFSLISRLAIRRFGERASAVCWVWCARERSAS
jgi:hypothetical protein